MSFTTFVIRSITTSSSSSRCGHCHTNETSWDGLARVVEGGRQPYHWFVGGDREVDAGGPDFHAPQSRARADLQNPGFHHGFCLGLNGANLVGLVGPNSTRDVTLFP